MNQKNRSFKLLKFCHYYQSKLAVCAIIMTYVLSGCAQYEDVTPKAILHNTTTVSLESAAKDLMDLMNEIESRSSRGAIRSSRKIGTTYTLSSKNNTRSDSTSSPIAHIINFDNNQGYAIMSADVRMPSLICLVESGNITPADTIYNTGFAIFCDGLEDYYDRKVSKNDLNTALPFKRNNNDEVGFIDNPYIRYSPWENIVYKYKGYCPVKWGQRSPYNNYCPLSNGERTLAGCIAVAVGQLMATHKYPSQYNGYNFNWSEMTTSPWASIISESAQHQVARLMQQLSIKNNLDMNYGIESSGAKSNNAVRTLRNFGYSNPGSEVEYNITEILDDLKSGFPVLCSGFSHCKKFKIFGWTISTQLTNGHMWVMHGLLERKRSLIRHDVNGTETCIGTESIYYPLCNWGWNGASDGYYLSDVFDAATRPIIVKIPGVMILTATEIPLIIINMALRSLREFANNS